MTTLKKKKTILIIDFDIQLSDLLNIWLAKEGFQVVQAHSGPVGLLMARRLKPNLILLEIRTPKLDGVDLFIRRLKTDPKTKGIKIAIFTDIGYFPLKEAKKIRVADFIKKEDCFTKFDQVIEQIKKLAK